MYSDVSLIVVMGCGWGQALARGLTKTNTLVEMLDLNSADSQELIECVSKCAAVVIMAPPSQGQANTAVTTLVPAIKGKQVSVSKSYLFSSDLAWFRVSMDGFGFT